MPPVDQPSAPACSRDVARLFPAFHYRLLVGAVGAVAGTFAGTLVPMLLWRKTQQVANFPVSTALVKDTHKKDPQFLGSTKWRLLEGRAQAAWIAGEDAGM